jgi:Xaa-Pro dipeptidase
MSLSRRGLFGAGATAFGVAVGGSAVSAPTPLSPMTAGARPIGAAERAGRLAKLQGLMRRAGVAALLVEPGASLEYVTGVRWHRSERVTVAVIPADGAICLVTPVFEEPSVRETLQVAGDVRAWNEDESPFALVAGVLRDRRLLQRPVAVEGTTRFFVVDAVREAAGVRTLPGDGFVRACRMIKSPAELALMQVANDLTLAALRHVHAELRAGMDEGDISALMDRTTRTLGAEPEFSLVLLNEASAYPHGSVQRQVVREGSTVLMDCGCVVHGYQSDISRTWVFGEPSARQRKVWNTVKRGQEIALETARVGLPCGAVDDAVRSFYTREGWGPGYRLPGLSHRTGHGIGLDGHEPPYLVHGDPTPLQPGMCFSDEPGLYIPGAFGVRLEDCWTMTQAGPRLFTPLAASVEAPV